MSLKQVVFNTQLLHGSTVVISLRFGVVDARVRYRLTENKLFLQIFFQIFEKLCNLKNNYTTHRVPLRIVKTFIEYNDTLNL